MSDEPKKTDNVTATDAVSYEPPDIAWEEPWEPVALAVSCARQQGNPGCGGGPFGS